MVKLHPMKIPLEQFAKKKLNERWIRVVRDIAPDKVEHLLECRKRFFAGKCEESHGYLKASLCRLREICPIDANAYTFNQSEDALEILNIISRRVGGGRLRVWGGEYTLPRSSWNKVGDSDAKKMKKIGSRTINGLFSDGGRYLLGYEVSFHHWHSSEPFRGWYPHLHVNISDVAWERDKQEWHRLNLYQNDLNQLSESTLSRTWRKNFEEEYGTVKAKRVVAHWAYRSGLGGVRHRLSYAMRNPVVDCYKAINWLEYHPESDRESVRRMLLRPKTEKRTQWFGYLSDGQKSKYLKKLEYVLEPKASRRKQRSKRVCPEDGTDINWNFEADDLDFVRSNYASRPVMTYGVPKEGVEFWKP